MEIAGYEIRKKEPDLIKGLIAGLVAGLVATYMKDRFQTLWTQIAASEQRPEAGDPTAQRESNISDDPTTVKAANAIAKKVLHRDLAKKEKELAGPIVDYGFGALAAMAYSAAAEVIPSATVGGGSGFGTAVWLFGDELAVPAAGLAKWPTEYPAKTHAYAFSGHLVFGLATELVRRVVRKSLG